MYRKGLSSRANKVSSLVASSDNAGTGTIEQASVPNAGVFGIRKNVFRNLPRIPPKKSVTPFSSMKANLNHQKLNLSLLNLLLHLSHLH